MLRVGEEMSDDSLISFSGWILTFVFINKGELSQAVKYGELSVEKAPTPQDQVWGQTALACAWIRVGKQRKGIEHLSQLVSMVRASRYVLHEVWSQVSIGEGYWLEGEFERAKQILKEAVELAGRWGMKYYIGWAQRILGEVALKTNLTKAPSHLEKSINVLKEINAENELALAYVGYGRSLKQQDETAQARGYLKKALEIFERLGTLIAPDNVRKELADLPNKHPIGS
jgi:tetratricopeptide (TPR) repeat protein